MSKKTFKEKCDALEKAGWFLQNYEPYAKRATYVRNGEVKRVKG